MQPKALWVEQATGGRELATAVRHAPVDGVLDTLGFLSRLVRFDLMRMVGAT